MAFHTVIIMIKIWLQILTAWFIELYTQLRGRVVVHTDVTVRGFKYTHLIPVQGEDTVKLVFVCRQHRHVMRYERWYIPRKVRYSYVVEMVRYKGVDRLDSAVSQYPQLCTAFLNHTTWPHRCAVNAYLDAYELNHVH